MLEDILIKVDCNLRLSLSSPQTEVTHHSPVEVVKSFSSIRTLKIQLLNDELGFGDGVLLKWRAEFGTSLEKLLKLRVVWTISSLIAGSARHFVRRQIISEHPGLERLFANRTQVQGLSMKLSYAPYIELPNGMGFKGATLRRLINLCPWLARLLVKRKTYILEKERWSLRWGL
ncbi:hypothetical protein AMTRI_Chr08g204840 [Amborella trichopoda]